MFIHNWNEFVSESQAYDLLLEGNLVISDRLKKLLSNVADQDAQDGVGRKILQFLNTNPETSDANLKQNYVDIAKPKEGEDKNSKIDVVSFIPQTKLNQLIERDPTLKDSDPFSIKGRTEVKVGRFLKAVCALADIKTTDREIERVVNMFKSSNDIPGQEMGLVEGKDIKFWYHEDNYLNDIGELGGSCMRYEKCQNYLNIYAKNPGKVKLLILTQNVDDVNGSGVSTSKKMLLGRALVWVLDESPCEAKIFMDRIYCSHQSDCFKFYNYAKKAGWMTKKNNNSELEQSIIFDYNGKTIKGRVKISLQAGPKSKSKEVSKTNWKYPFMDTICFLNSDKNEISNVGYIGGWVMESTNGSINRCSGCNGSGREDCDYCDGSGKMDCRTCDGNGGEDCTDCYGDGEIEKECADCNGNGHNQCPDCKGEGTAISAKGRKIICKTCKGDGDTSCKTCKGNGDIVEKCEKCDGKGDIKCEDCDGSGNVKCEMCSKNKGQCSECVGLLENN